MELTVSVKTAESTYKQKYLRYDTLTLDTSDPEIRGYIAETLRMLNIEKDQIEDIKVRTVMVIK